MGEEVRTIDIPSDVTVWKADEVRALLLDALENSDQVALKVHDVRTVDVTFLQMLISAHRMVVEKGKTLSFPGGKQSAIAEAAMGLGFAAPVKTAGGWPW